MAFATVQQVRAIVFTSTLTDPDIQATIDEVSGIMADVAGTAGTGNRFIRLAGKYAIYAAVIRKAIETTEFAQRVKRGSSEQQQDLTAILDFYESESRKYVAKYLNSDEASPKGAFIYGRSGWGTVNNRIK